MIGGLVMAAGLSKRCKTQNKLLVEFDGASMIAHVVIALKNSSVEQIVVVTGHEHEKISKQLNDYSVECCYNKSFANGLASSLSIGISALKHADAVIVCLGDMPHVSTDTIDTVVNTFKAQTKKSLLVPTYKSKRGNPVLIGRKFFELLLMNTGDKGARQLIDQQPADVLEVDVDSSSILTDYDTDTELSELSSNPPHSH